MLGCSFAHLSHRKEKEKSPFVPQDPIYFYFDRKKPKKQIQRQNLKTFFFATLQ
jgi:hypothetical protein